MVTQQRAQRANFGPMWPEVTGFGAGPNKQIFCVLAGGQNIKNSLSWPRKHCLPFSDILEMLEKIERSFIFNKSKISYLRIITILFVIGI